MQRRALLATLALPAVAGAQGFDHSIRIIVPFAPGGTSDILARILAPSLSRQLGQQVVVENRSGAAGMLGADLVAKGPADGHTLLLIDTSALVTAPSLYSRLSFDPLNDLAPVNLLIFAPYILAVNPGVPAQNAAELVALARARPAAVNFAHAGVGAATHLGGLLLAQHWRADLTLVPYRGGAASVAAVAGGEAQLVINGATATAPFVRDGRLRGIAVTGPSRLGQGLENLPTFAELGWPGPNSGTFQGVFVSGRTPPAMVARLDQAFRTALAEPENAQRMAALGAEIRATGPTEFRSWMAAETRSWGEVVRTNNIRLD